MLKCSIGSDGPGDYPVISISTAGDAPNEFETLQIGQISRIATGAPLPPGADGVIMVEVTQLMETTDDHEEKIVRILESCNVGDNIREIGSDIKKYEIVLESGHSIGPADVGLLATVGRTEVNFSISPSGQLK